MRVLCGEDEAKVQTFLITTKDLKKNGGLSGKIAIYFHKMTDFSTNRETQV